MSEAAACGSESCEMSGCLTLRSPGLLDRTGTREGPVERIDTENPRGPKVVFYDEKHDREVAHNPTTVRKLADAGEREDTGGTVDEEGQDAGQGARATRGGATTIPENVKEV